MIIASYEVFLQKKNNFLAFFFVFHLMIINFTA